MELPGHLGVALLVYAPVAALAVRRGRSGQAWIGLSGVLVLAMSPDVDLYLPGVAHRGITHTAWAALLMGGLVALVACLPRSRGWEVAVGRARFGAGVGSSAVFSHLLGDVITPMGIRPFFPLSETTYTLSLVYAADPRANLALLVAGVVTFMVVVTSARKPGPARTPGLDRTRRERA